MGCGESATKAGRRKHVLQDYGDGFGRQAGIIRSACMHRVRSSACLLLGIDVRKLSPLFESGAHCQCVPGEFGGIHVMRRVKAGHWAR